jgi:hypothetical protein
MKLTKFILSAIITVFLTTSAYAGGFGGDDGAGGTNDVPIDGGVSLLVGAAAVYGAKKFRDKAKKSGDTSGGNLEK